MARRVGLAGFHRLPVDWLITRNSWAPGHSRCPSRLTWLQGDWGRCAVAQCENLRRAVGGVQTSSVAQEEERGTDQSLAMASKGRI